MRFFLGTHRLSWLGKVDFPIFVSNRYLRRRKSLPRASAPWALDSGGFSELSIVGHWTWNAKAYVRDVQRYADEIGSLAWAAPMDWMCEEFVVEKTGLSIPKHQRLTIHNFLELRALAPHLPFIPVLQGFSRDDYVRCIDAYWDAGVDLRRYPTVGIGSVCRRQATSEIKAIVSEVASFGIRLHGFGVKTLGLEQYAAHLTSADSMAWSFQARREGARLDNCEHKGDCRNCIEYAKWWRERLLSRLRQRPRLSTHGSGCG